MSNAPLSVDLSEQKDLKEQVTKLFFDGGQVGCIDGIHHLWASSIHRGGCFPPSERGPGGIHSRSAVSQRFRQGLQRTTFKDSLR